jgi:hypothetical protein
LHYCFHLASALHDCLGLTDLDYVPHFCSVLRGLASEDGCLIRCREVASGVSGHDSRITEGLDTHQHS